MLLLSIELRAQLNVDIYSTANHAIEDVFKGHGITITNSTVSGMNGSWGTFETGINPTDLGFNNGIILSTGNITTLNQEPSNLLSVNNGGDSSIIIQTEFNTPSTFDKCSIGIDFIPMFDTLEIKYIFASEEYPEYVGSTFTDAFGFFLTGQAPQGTSYVNHNFAEVPGLPNQVNVNTINNGLTNNGQCINCQYYRPGIPNNVYDGMTTVLTAKIAVIPNETYHLDIIIADVTDRYFDSGIFLQANSLKTICDTTYFTDNFISMCTGDSYTINGHTYNYSGTYYDTLVSYLGCDSIILTHLNIPYIQNYFSTLSQQGNQITLSNQSYGQSYSFIWDFGDGFYRYQNSLDTISHTYENGGFYNICLSVIDTLSSCFRKQCVNVSINTTPNNCDAQFIYSIIGDTVFFNSSMSQGLITDYYWIFETGEESHEANPYIILHSPGMYAATLRVLNSTTDCSSERQEIIYFGDYWLDCKADFTYFPIANENRVVFNNASIGQDLDYFIWDFGDGTYSNLKNPTHNYSTSGNHDVCLTVSSSLNNSVHTRCNRIISGEPNLTCRGNIQIFTPLEILNPESIPVNIIGSINSSQPNSNYSILWNFGDSTILQNQMESIHTYLEIGLYIVRLNINSALCNDDVFELVNLSGENQLNVMFGAILLDDGTKDEGEKPVKFKGVTMGEPSLFNWDFGDGETDTTSLFPIHTFAPNMVHNVCLTVKNKKTNQTDTYCKNIFIVDSTAQVAEIESDIQIKCYPNPTNSMLNIDFSLSNSSKVLISIFDVNGIKQKQIFDKSCNKGIFTQNIDLSDFASGVYFIYIETEKSLITKKLIIFK